MARKGNQHNNILRYKNLTGEEKEYEFIVRGCTIRHRDEIWIMYINSVGGNWEKENDNSYLIFEDEPDAIMTVVKGEHFGTAGYVGKEFTGDIKKILSECELYRIDLKDEEEVGNKEMTLVMRYR